MRLDDAHLTLLEAQVLVRLGEGKRNAEIAAELNLAEKTVRNVVSTILDKLEVSNRTEAALLLQAERAEWEGKG